ncbi:MAG: prepilin-type N-terminal cleavage/methylation domain-containing protein [Planctomycetota bacterium]
MKRSRRAGFTLIEVVIALTILVLISANIAMISRTGSKAAESDLFRQVLDGEMNVTMDRIRFALMSASADNVYPTLSKPLSNDSIDFSTSMGVQAGVHVMGDPERIRWQPTNEEKGRVLWTQGLGMPDERELQWSQNVPTLQDREILNTIDDNNNGLDDEPGLAFHVEQAQDKEMQIFVTLTISKEDSTGNRIPTSRQVNVTCRN